MKAVIYCRVSTEEQETENQVIVLTKWAEQRGIEVARIYRENESAWKSGHQRELARLMEDAVNRKFDVLLVWALDRLSREGSLAILQLVNKLKVYGMKVYSYQEPWTESAGEISELLYAITGWIARMESQRRSERTLAGINRARLQGKHIGRPLGRQDAQKRKRKVYDKSN
jgi:putative DNA-invertase from lambdoid prophage Rac